MSADSTASPWSNGCSRSAIVCRDSMVFWTCSSDVSDCANKYFASNHCDCTFNGLSVEIKANCLCAKKNGCLLLTEVLPT